MNSTIPQPENTLEAFLRTLTGQSAEDAKMLIDLMQSCTGQPPVLWGKNIVGFGSYHYKYATGREGDNMVLGFSPRAKAISLYMTNYFPEYPKMLARLGKHSTGASCLYIKKLSDVDLAVLKEILLASVDWCKEKCWA